MVESEGSAAAEKEKARVTRGCMIAQEQKGVNRSWQIQQIPRRAIPNYFREPGGSNRVNEFICGEIGAADKTAKRPPCYFLMIWNG